MCPLWQRIAALEDMLQNVHGTPSCSSTETAAPSITNCVNQTSEFRVPYPVPLSGELEKNHDCATCFERGSRSCGPSELLSRSMSSTDSIPAMHDRVTAPTVSSASPLTKRRKVSGN